MPAAPRTISPSRPGGWSSWGCRSTCRTVTPSPSGPWRFAVAPWHSPGAMRHWMSWLCFALPVAALAAQPSGTRSAAEELDAELNAQVKIPGPELVIITDGPDPDRYALAEAAMTLDGRPLPGPVQPGLGKRFYEGPISAGNHVITAEFVYRGGRTGAYPWSDSYGFRVPGKVEFSAQRGLRLVVHLRVETHDDAEDARGKLAFRAALEPEMIAKVDDTPLPPPPKPVLPPQGSLSGAAPAGDPTPGTGGDEEADKEEERGGGPRRPPRAGAPPRPPPARAQKAVPPPPRPRREHVEEEAPRRRRPPLRGSQAPERP